MAEKRIKVVLTPAGETWESTKEYKLLDYIAVEGKTLYVCIKTDAATGVNVGHALTDAEWWNKCLDVSVAYDAAQKAAATANAATAAANKAITSAATASTNANVAATAADTATSKAIAAATNADTATAKASTATAAAEKVNATLTDAGNLTVTDRTGAKKSVDLTTAAEATQMRADIDALKQTVEGQGDYYVAEHDDVAGSTEMKNGRGNKELLGAWHPYLIDMTDNAGEVTHPVGQLKDNNHFRFVDGSFAPTVGITEEQRAQCDVQLYTDAEHTQELTLPNGTVVTAKGGAHPYDAAEVYDALGLVDLYDGEGNKVRQLLPWETTERKYTVGIAHDEKLYLVDRQEGADGRMISGIFRRQTTYDGIDTGRFALERTALSPSPVAKVGGRLVCLYFDCDAGDSASKNSAGQGSMCSMYKDGRVFPAVSSMTQITNMQWARSANADAQSPVPFAEGGWMAKNTFITCMELLYGTKYLHKPTMFSGGICTNDNVKSEDDWRTYCGTRWREQGTENWSYVSMGGNTPFGISVKSDGTLNTVTWWSYTNGYFPHERTMEAQMAASWATEMGIEAGEEYEAYGTTYRYEDAAGAPTLRDGAMNCRIFILRKGTGQGWKTTTEKVTYDIEQMLRVGLVGGMNLWGDIFTYEGGGCEMVGTSKETVATNSGTGKEYKDKTVDIYLCADQSKWQWETADRKTDYGRFGFEDVYSKVGTIGPPLPVEGYVKKRLGFAPYKTENGGSRESWQCAYGWSFPYWAVADARTRIALRLRCYASSYVSCARSLYASSRVTYGYANYGGSAQCRIG